MEDIFEILLSLIVIGVGLAAKQAKKRKKAEPPKRPTAWDELDEEVEERFEEFMEKRDGEPIIPYAPSQPVQPAVSPAQPAPVPIIVQTVPDIDIEGLPAEPVLPPAPKPMQRPVKKDAVPIQSAHNKSRSRLIPEKINADTLRSAFVMSEVLGKPVALRSAPRR